MWLFLMCSILGNTQHFAIFKHCMPWPHHFWWLDVSCLYPHKKRLLKLPSAGDSILSLYLYTRKSTQSGNLQCNWRYSSFVHFTKQSLGCYTLVLCGSTKVASELTILGQVATALSLQVPPQYCLWVHSGCQPSILRHFHKLLIELCITL